MQKGAKYYIEFWVKAVENSIKINNIGACMTVDTFPKIKTGFYDYDVHLNSEDVIHSSKDDEWVKVSSTICAADDYRYISLGNFHLDWETTAEKETTSLDYAFYLIDDVLVEDMNTYCDGSAKVEVESFMNVKNVLYESNSAQLKPSSFSELDKLVLFLKQNTKLNTQIVGHTDNVGDPDANIILSSDRAYSVKDYLITEGIEEHRLFASGMGENIPIATNETEQGRSVNRRVNIILIQK